MSKSPREKSKGGKKGGKGPALPPPHVDKVNIFISYAREDKELASSLYSELSQMFGFAPVEVFRDLGLQAGENWRQSINASLDTADILIVVITETKKSIYSYPGYELGYFEHSLKVRPYICEGVKRVIIPLLLGAEIPETVRDLQGIKVPQNEVFRINELVARPSSSTVIDLQNPAHVMLKRIFKLAIEAVGKAADHKSKESVDEKVAAPAARLYDSMCDFLQQAVSSEMFPERKIIIHADRPPAVKDDGADLSNATIELIGNSFQVFGLKEDATRMLDWDDFVAKMPSGDFGNTWSDGIRSLVTVALNGGEDNYHVVTNSKGDKAFRLFVSRVVTFHSRRMEIHIYIVEMIVRHFGNPQTSQLLSAISIGLRYRFMLLEEESEFNPRKLKYPLATSRAAEPPVLRAKVRDLLNQVDLLMRDSAAAKLMDPALLERLWGKGSADRVQEMMDKWEKAIREVYAAAKVALVTTEASYDADKAALIEALEALRTETHTMNREYTSRALREVTQLIEKQADIKSQAAE